LEFLKKEIQGKIEICGHRNPDLDQDFGDVGVFYSYTAEMLLINSGLSSFIKLPMSVSAKTFFKSFLLAWIL
jgi:hypothetical protein